MSSSGTRSAILRAEIVRAGSREITCALEMTDESVLIVTDRLPSVGEVVSLRLSFPRTLSEVAVDARVRQVRMSAGPGSPAGFVAEFDLAREDARREIRRLAHRIRPTVEAAASRELVVLLVEDNQLIRDMFAYTAQRYFGPRGLRVQLAQAATAAEAWAHFRKGVVPNVIVVDHVLPDATGASFVTALREDPTLRGVPIVGMSVGDAEVRAAMLDAGADLFLHKPIALKDLFCTLEFLMSCGAGSARGAA